MKKNKRMRYNRKMKMIAVMLMNVFACQLLFPNVAMALTSGPTQPEVQGFEPVGTTDMVDMFSGSFVYNIPLMDVEGYPVNISYHGGVTMEQEASWVGLGWNINPGVINRTVRGVPDDFNGDSLFKDFNIKPEKNIRVGVGIGLELGGHGDPKQNTLVSLNFNSGANINVSNYRGVSCDFSLGGGINVFHCVSAGVNLGVGSQTGASIDYNASLSFSSSMLLSKEQDDNGPGGGGLNAGVGGGYSTRSGIKDLSLSISASVSSNTTVNNDGHAGSGSLGSSSATIPISIKNYVPVITNSSVMNSIYGRIKVGGELASIYAYANASAMFSKLTYNNDASRSAYGYMYLQNANINNADILDFTRDKDGMFNKSMQYLPVPNMTYDIYSLSGQGTSGMFRPFRNDFGNVYDPFTTSVSSTNSGEGEIGVGDIFEAGLDLTHSNTEITSGPWGGYQRSGTISKGFTKTSNGSVFENVYFKQGGELTSVDPSYFTATGGLSAITPDAAMGLPQIKPGSDTRRDPRSNLIYYHTAQEDTASGVGTNSSIVNYTDPTFTTYGNPSTTAISRIGTGQFQRKKDQISEIVQVQKDGRKYIYGIPALNNVQREVTFTVDASNSVDLGSGIVSFGGTDATNHNSKGRDNYYSSSVTPAYAHSYLLTSVLSNDYVDVTGDGISDDDLGSFTKFDYTRTDSDYRWIAPYSSDVSLAQYNPGFWSDKLDDKGSFVCGSREQWNLHAIETKNFIAEFYTSVREDALGIAAPILNNGESTLFQNSKSSGHSYSYKLDSIKLYNKHDRFVNGANAIPVKSVFFVYDYSLCSGIPNSSTGGGKLTLQKIYFSYGNSQKSMISPYQFTYGYNPAYDLSAKDRWGCYKPNNTAFTNYEYPYVNQNDTLNDTYASAWSLTNINLPSGGVIKACYESNDYAYVQDKPVNEMFMVNGLGNSPDFIAGSQLYADKNSPYLYAYFTRRPGTELSSLTFAQNYMGINFIADSQYCMYFNFHVQLTDEGNTYEQIKGYANVLDAGICSNDSSHGYIRFQSVIPEGGGGNLHPITFTALNVGRYNLPQIVFPGQNPDESDLTNILSGLAGASEELFTIGRNPVLNLMARGGGKAVNLTKSYIRLQSIGLKKKGGGQRVKLLSFSDQWDTLAGGHENVAYYGKQYIYKIKDATYGEISSGVASYEPLIGGDENPFRQPVQYYAVQKWSKWPPNDPVDLYQESPIGESLFPSGQVGYSSVKVVSLHKDEGRSSKTSDEYDFYTAKDFPVQFTATAISANSPSSYTFFSQQNRLTATQGYCLIFNDMHGKPKKVEHDVYSAITGLYEPISYQVYNYNQVGNKLKNNVNCLVYDGTNMVEQTMQLGIEEDITLDSRQKNELTTNYTLNSNLNFFDIGETPLLLPYGFGWSNSSQNEFQSAVVTKVVQQYGILDNIESYNEGAKTMMRNEIYDPTTGQPVVTSINNEFQDKEYTTSIPASWVYKGMSGAYNNIGYKDTGTISIDGNHIGTLNIINTAPLIAGDQLSVFYKDASGNNQHTTAWVMGILPVYSGTGAPTCSGLNVLPRFPLSTPGWTAGSVLQNVRIEVISSGYTNMLNETVETYSSAHYPVHSLTTLDQNLSGLIDLKAKTFSDSNTRIFHNYINNADTINPYAIGERGQWRLLSEYSYQTNRDYANTTSRNSGLFNALSLFVPSSGSVPTCMISPYNYLMPSNADSNWHAMRTITKWSPFGKEVENIDAIGNYSTAVYGYNEDLPIAVAANAKQGEILTLGFEDYDLLKTTSNIISFNYFPFVTNGVADLPVPSPLYYMTLPKDNIIVNDGHTGMQCYSAVRNNIYMNVPVNFNKYAGAVNNYNNYFSNSPTSGYNFTSANEYLPFGVLPGKDYIASYWIKLSSAPDGTTSYYLGGGNVGVVVYDTLAGSRAFALEKKSNIIDGWELVETKFSVPANVDRVTIGFPTPLFLIDDLRIFPANANMKSFVYSPVNSNLHATNEKLMATLDENNFATMYEYDQEGNLVRVKKETAKGIMTVSESRSGNHKK